eukprot:CAMPEP_0177703986 /NCGR_PEP_ID=MMETSP0484_2-20121128/7958_1 /TAXON_ID=354590 /ORGANISM="Rhodomonas lens, Strain RHODO" /LENGTH=832 /DNA_ID=CAMNT_0019215365 /DNA_START=51 /DNA_END=2549 /DNA_ORIENTATION=-
MEGEGGSKRPEWIAPPQQMKRLAPMVANTLTGNKVEFIPKDGNTVRWYICGPTVYDSSHLGHARTYVAFDVVRRILENFFGYDIFCVMNVTDVDDKIIIRARRNYLLKQYKETKPSLDQVLVRAKAEVEKAVARYNAKVDKLKADIEKETQSGKVKGLKEELDATHYKHGLTEKQAVYVAEAEKGAISDPNVLLDKAADLISSSLDEEKKEEVTDPQIFRAHAAYYEKEYIEDMNTLGVRMPDVLTRVTEFMPEIVKYIEKIIANDFAYEAQGSVYFDIRKFCDSHGYRKLSWSEASVAAALAEGEGALSSSEGKRSDADFALWKKSKAGEPSWDSPWGGGRPGWHIECSVMASEMLGDTLDIHGGGIDLCFPHHDNELAQAEAYYGHQQWVNYFLHSGHLYIGSQKMSKSLKNFFTIREILKGGSEMKLSEEESITLPPYTARQLRILFMMHQWDQPMYFSKDTLDVAVGKEKTFKEFFGAVRGLNRDQVNSVTLNPQNWGEHERTLNSKIEETQKEVTTALIDNFNTPKVLLLLQELVTAANIYMTTAGAQTKSLLVHKAAMYIAKTFRTLGIDDNATEYPFASSTGGGGDQELLSEVLDAFCGFREDVRQAARSNQEPGWFQAKVSDLESGLLAELRSKIKSKAALLPAVLEAFEAWTSKIKNTAQSQGAKSEYLELCDSVRDDALPLLGVRLEDKPEGFLWKLDDPEVLARERATKMAAAAEAAKKKVENKLNKAKKELEKWEVSAVAPSEMFKALTDKYKTFDDQGMPTHAADGTELSKKQRQGVEKDFKKREAEHAKFQEQEAKEAGFLGKLKAEIKAMEDSLAAM